MFPRSSRSNPTRLRTELTSCSYTGERQLAAHWRESISVSDFLSPGLPAEQDCISELQALKNFQPHFRFGNPSPMTVAQTVSAERKDRDYE